MKKLILLIIIFITISNENVFAEDFSNSKQLSKEYCNQEININFITNEKLFTFLVWIVWMGGTEEYEKYVSNKSLLEIKSYLKNINVSEKVYQKNKLAYENLIKYSNSDAFSFITFFLKFYDNPPEFNFTYPNDQVSTGNIYNKVLPNSIIISDFYKEANIHKIWIEKYQPKEELLIKKYKEKIEGTFSELLCFFREKSNRPLYFSFNVIEGFPAAGVNIDYDTNKNRYIIINMDVPENEESFIEYIETIRHELSHFLFDNSVKYNQNIINDKIKKVFDETDTSKYTIQPQLYELLADSIGKMDIYGYFSSAAKYRGLTKGHISYLRFYYERGNILLHFFLNDFDNFRKSGMSFNEYIPILFKRFDPNKEVVFQNKIKQIMDELDK